MNSDLTDFSIILAKMATLNDEVQHKAVEMASAAYSAEKLYYFYNLSYGLLSLLSAVELKLQQGEILTSGEWSLVQQCYKNISYCNEQIQKSKQSLLFDVTSMLFEAIKNMYNK